MSKEKIKIKGDSNLSLQIGKLLLLYGDDFAIWLNKNMERLVKEWQDEYEEGK